MRPMGGIYVSRTRINGNVHASVSNIGTRPSFDDGDFVNCETHIIGYDGDLYDTTVTVEFFVRLRDEKQFPSIDTLRTQLDRDISDAVNFFSSREEGL